MSALRRSRTWGCDACGLARDSVLVFAENRELCPACFGLPHAAPSPWRTRLVAALALGLGAVLGVVGVVVERMAQMGGWR